MPAISNRNAQRFAALRRACTDALVLINAAIREAARAGAPAEVQRDLIRSRETIRDRMVEIGRAEDAFERAAMSVAEAEARLKGAVGQARAAVEAMKRVADALRGAAELINLLGRLATLFA